MTAQRFKGVLLKPLDQQHDRDGDRIDPNGVEFDPGWVVIHAGFDYSKPPIGRGRISREEDGTLVMEGEFFERQFKEDEDPPWKLAIGVACEGDDHVGGVITKSKLMGSVGITTEHVDETQPVIEIIKEGHMNIVRLGHYHIPSGAGEKGTCQWATVIKVVEDDPTRAVVNLKVIDSDGDEKVHLSVQQDDPYNGIQRASATFHLSGECPWLR